MIHRTTPIDIRLLRELYNFLYLENDDISNPICNSMRIVGQKVIINISIRQDIFIITGE